jgi:hypothetical protein
MLAPRFNASRASLSSRARRRANPGIPSGPLRHHRYCCDSLKPTSSSFNLFLDHLAIKIDVLKLKLKLKLKLQAPWLPQVHSCSE